ncbi:glycosyltransferase family 39 protein [Candidatus Woesearchaeota archaeon]|nr:glycosyltransferase family 39 protein [Candidatus Woesearchaeota archaeon]
MVFASIVLFFLYFWGFGFATTSLARAKEAGNFLERQIMRIGIGAAAVIILAMIMHAARIPLDWKIFFALAAAYPAYYLLRNYRKIKLGKVSVSKSDINTLLVLLIFAGSLYMYASGAFAYPYVEDDDPWGHVEGARYIATEKTFSLSPYKGFQYMNPYPPSYDFVFGLMHQTEKSLYWTVKFFNALIISLSLVFFYFFAARFLENRNKALFATAVLAAVPAYLSHFIWSPALAMMMFFPAMYCLEKIKDDKRWKWVAAIALGGLLVSHPTSTLTLFVMVAMYAAVKVLLTKNLKAYATAVFGGVIASLSWWGFDGKAFYFTATEPARRTADAVQQTGLPDKALHTFLKTFHKWSGTASRPYTFEDFFIAKGQNLINNPVGIGKAVMLLFLVGLVAAPIMSIKRLNMKAKIVAIAVAAAVFILTYLSTEKMLHLIAAYSAVMIAVLFATGAWKEKTAYFISLLWFLWSFLIVNNLTFDFPVGFFAFRTWMVMAVPLALIAAEGLWSLFAMQPMLRVSKNLAVLGNVALILAVLPGIWLTSAEQKYEVNTATWPPGAFWTSMDELSVYLALKELPAETKVFSFFTDGQILAMDKYSCGWCEAEGKFRQGGLNKSAEEVAAWMKQNDYEYMIIGGMEAQRFGQNETIRLLNDMAASGLFAAPYQNSGAVVLKVI